MTMDRASDNKKIGMRLIKTTAAVFLCLVIRVLFRQGSTMFYGAIAAVMCMQPTTQKTIHAGVHRFIGTLAGAFVGFLVLEGSQYIPWYDPYIHLLVIPGGMLLAAYGCVRLGRRDSVAICCIVYLSIVTNFDRTIAGTGVYVVTRIIDTGIGIAVATLVNLYLGGAPEYPQDQDKET